MRRAIATATLWGLALLPMVVPVTAAEEAPATKDDEQAEATPAAEHIEVQHILISFKGRLPGKNITRTLDEAKGLAARVLERAKGGEDFGELVKEFSNDDYPGIYRMANKGVEAVAGEFKRGGMVQGFGDVSFGLAVGEIGVADYDTRKSPYGWHIVKRLK